MLEKLLQYIKKLFGIKETRTSTEKQRENQNYDDEYSNTEETNIPAIASNKLATLSLSDSTVAIEENNIRCEVLNVALQEAWQNMKKIVARALGTGGCIIVPYVKNGKILFNTAKQNRLVINGKDGEKITRATVIAEKTTINDKVYYRVVDYTVENNTLYIKNRAITDYGTPANLPEWENIKDVAISNVDRVLFGFMKSPIDNRKNADDYGVPITYGCKKTIDDILECLEEIRKEFRLKQVRLQVDDRTLDRDPKTGKPILKDDLFIAGHTEDGKLFNIFDPAFRESSLHARLDKLFEILEKQIGTSRGILTAPATQGATATEIKAANGDTFSLVSDIRKAIEKCLQDYIYACDVLANYYNITPPGEYEIKYDWSYSLIESTTEDWQQMNELQSKGIVSKAELRAWRTGESIEEAQKAVDEIAKNEPTVKSLLGMNE